MNFSSFISFIFALLLVASITFAFSGTGSGTSESPYIITNCSQLQEMNNALNSYYSLGNNIDCSMTKNWNEGKGFDPIGGDEFYNNSDVAFSGVLLGNNHSINGLYFKNGDSGYVGLFSYTNGARIENLKLVDFNIVNGWKLGGLVSVARFTTIESVKANGSIGYYIYPAPVSTGFSYYSWIYAGGIANTIYNSKISNSVSEVDFIGGDYGSIGGIVEQAYDSIIINSDNNHSINPIYRARDTGKIISDAYFVGGIVYKATRTSIISCTNRGAIISNLSNGGEAEGGLGGVASYIVDSTINNSINLADLNASLGTNYGGIVAKAKTSFITNSKNYGDLNEGVGAIGGIAGYINQSVVTNSDNFGDIKSFKWNRGVGVGGVVGKSWKAVIQNVSNIGSLDYNGDEGLGGVLGFGTFTVLKKCNNSGNISGHDVVDYVGGITGYIDDSNISDCNNSGSILFGNSGIGGIGGELVDSVAKRVYNTGLIYPFSPSMQKDSWHVGGLFGHLFFGIISDSLNYGNVRGSYETGGLVGFAGNSLDISNTHNYGSVSGRRYTSGIFHAYWGEFRMNNVTTLYGVTNSNRSITEEYYPYCDYLLSGGGDALDTYDCDALNYICPSESCNSEIYFRHCGANSPYNHDSIWKNVCYLDNKKGYLEQSGYFDNLGSSGSCVGPIFGNNTEYEAFLITPDLLENSFVGLVDGNNARGCQNWCSASEYVDDVAGLLPICRSRSSGTKYCIGGGFLNSEIYLNDNVGLTTDVKKTLTDSNSSAKCEYHCIDGYKLVGGECVQENVCVNNDGKCVPPCDGSKDSDCRPCGPSDLICPWYCNGLNDPDCPPLCLVSGVCDSNGDCCSGSCVGGLCASVCEANGVACDSNGDCCSGSCVGGLCSSICINDDNRCVPPCNILNDNDCAGGKCLGSFSNAFLGVDENVGLSGDLLSILAISNNVNKKCEWFCEEDFVKGRGADENTCVPEFGYGCISPDGNALIYPGDDFPTTDISYYDHFGRLSVQDTTKKCDYFCNRDLDLVISSDGLRCVARGLDLGECGDFNRVYYLGEEFPGEGSFCDNGSALYTEDVRLPSYVGPSNPWKCVGVDGNVWCTAYRSDSVLFDVNAILDLNVKYVEGDLLVTIKCAKPTRAELSLFNKELGIDLDKTVVDCGENYSTVRLRPAMSLAGGEVYSLRASIKAASSDCSVCSKTDFFATNTDKQKNIPDNTIFGLIAVLFVVLGLIAFSKKE